MCGIAGTINKEIPVQDVLLSMAHRGPDEQHSFQEDNLHLLHARLAIQGIREGQQPMTLHQRFTIVYNGEIYNHEELRKKFDLKARTSSDTETILLLYEKIGAAFLSHTDGMFALAIYDNQKKELFITRDRAGKKPLYWFLHGNQFGFASEINTMRTLFRSEVNDTAIYQYLRLGSFYKSNTPYMHVRELGAGTWLKIQCDTLQMEEKNWWSIHPFYLQQHTDSFSEALQKTDSILHTAIQRRLSSTDLEVGSFLSGGIDSGLITAIASRYQKNLKTFTVSFDGSFDESHLARMVAERYGTDHHEIRISFDHLKNDLETILGNYGEPFFDSSAIPSYYVSKESAKHISVVLNGDGADELFGGYRRYVPFARYDFFRQKAALRAVAKTIRMLSPAPRNKKSAYNYLYRLAALASKTGLEIYLSAGVDIFEDYEHQITRDSADYMQEAEAYFQSIARSRMSGLKKLMNLDFDVNLFDDLLVKMDIATMANSQEGRSAFLCREFLEYIPGLPDSYKIQGTTTKYILRKLAENYLPAELIHQPKRGFEIPLRQWLDNELKEILFDYLSSSAPFYSTFVNKSFVLQLLNRQISVPEEKRAKILWTLLALEIWHKQQT